MAKNNDLFGFFLCLVAGLCIGFGGVVVESFQQSAISCQPVSEIDSGVVRGIRAEVFMTDEIDLRSFRWPCVLGASSVSFGSSSAIMEAKSGYVSIPSVILSGMQGSRKISLFEAEPVRLARSSFSAFNQQIYSLVSVPKAFMSASQFSIRYVPVEKTADGGGAFEATSLEANLVRNKIKQIYAAEIGVREKTGKNDGERVEEYLAVTRLRKGYAWCAAFVSWVFSEAGFPEPRTPWSPALFPKKRVIWERGRESLGPDVLANRVESLNNKIMLLSNTHNLVPNTQYLLPNTHNLAPITQNLISRKPKSADVFGIYFANLKRIAHVGFVDEWGDKQIITVEGNTNEAGSREGDGVYRKRRPIVSIYQVANWIDLEGES